MTDWYMGLAPLMQVFWGCAIVGGTIFIIQTIMSFLGADAETDFDAGVDFDGDTLGVGGAMNMFTLRGLINFILAFGVTGIGCRDMISSNALLLFVAFAVGVGFVFLWAFIMQKLMGLEHDGNIQPEDVVGCVASVYLRIPKGGLGKIQVSVNGSVHEYEAIADCEIATGCQVKVTALEGTGVYRVEELSKQQ